MTLPHYEQTRLDELWQRNSVEGNVICDVYLADKMKDEARNNE